MARQKYRYYVRKFLNKHHQHSTGFVWIVVPQTDPNKPHDRCDIEFRIADCSRQIDLDFDMYSPEDRRNSLYKADLLLDAVTQFRDALLEECAIADERDAIAAEERKKNKKPAAPRKTLWERIDELEALITEED